MSGRSGTAHENGVADMNMIDDSGDPLLPFLVGAAVGGIAGAVVGTILSQRTTHLVAALISVVDRRLHEADRERLKFELLLQ